VLTSPLVVCASWCTRRPNLNDYLPDLSDCNWNNGPASVCTDGPWILGILHSEFRWNLCSWEVKKVLLSLCSDVSALLTWKRLTNFTCWACKACRCSSVFTSTGTRYVTPLADGGGKGEAFKGPTVITFDLCYWVMFSFATPSST